MDKSLAVLLPIFNAERTLRADVNRVLEAAADLTNNVQLVVIDDGSHDDTFEIATELSAEFPQVRVIRNSHRRGVADAVRAVRSSILADVVIVHDGGSRVNVEQMRLVWTQQQLLQACRDGQDPRRGVSFADLRRPGRTQPALEAAHRRLMGFQRADDAAVEALDADELRRRDEAGQPKPRRGVGGIPSLPGQNVFGVLSNFALGE
ncbi:glycosyltransferase [Botrimarina hoheduenensis]|uniref:Poly-beta-1,6-N-acetyl-D-glucosamine synthase n=1 Tax=Botrimarina hoheduenensis TaxID=2528000 RepID=A0A5C5WC76_9BACT|nr:glycosyltransferase [Botrimarina hoheduenensis]TWT47272.1 Poly-beta-1,6-N-acetyl-D-glucosamine synthase [Botrimarina hoheduenensis]